MTKVPNKICKEDNSLIRKNALKSWWFICDKWFRVLEFSLILGTLYYFSHKINNLLIDIIYWISWFFIYAWFLELGEYISGYFSNIEDAKKKRFIWISSMFFVIVLYTLVTESTKWIIGVQFNNI